MQTNILITYSSQIQKMFLKFVVQCYLPRTFVILIVHLLVIIKIKHKRVSSIKLTEPIMALCCKALWDIHTPAAGLFCPLELKHSLSGTHVPSLLPSWAPKTDFVIHLYDLLPADSTGVVHFLRHVILKTCTGVQCQKHLNKWFWNAVLSVQ